MPGGKQVKAKFTKRLKHISKSLSVTYMCTTQPKLQHGVESDLSLELFRVL